MKWLERLKRLFGGAAARSRASSPRGSQALPRVEPRSAPAAAGPRELEPSAMRSPSDSLLNFDRTPPGVRRRPRVFETDPMPWAGEQPSRIESEPVSGQPWEVDSSNNVVICSDDALRRQERSVQDKFSAFRGEMTFFEPLTDEEMSWETDDDAEDAEPRKKKKPSQLSFDFGEQNRPGS
ncbi:hypothetical protein MAF45_08450 [Mesosutterella sp. OilRF-GAM-744-9]|uniref:Uncharacterized protein n=1 Tax=Mesosutterella porci TaxID=2915351 RepID=A0ABS9MS89_9BURK|nr:hypothetical protein [Mesosutterella sp. oilRF-744-WT-GAM-9]MCG5031469.1 hypothetical protein [Mesosutterella sp. oilRF-744-WT-GAM-9]